MDWNIEYLAAVIFIVIIIFVFAYKKITRNPDALTSKHRKERTYPNSIENLDDLIRKALMKVGFNKVGFNDDLKRYYASAGMTLWSYGENITVQYTMKNKGQAVHFSSVCVFPIQLTDWGKNKNNSTRFFKELDVLIR